MVGNQLDTGHNTLSGSDVLKILTQNIVISRKKIVSDGKKNEGELCEYNKNYQSTVSKNFVKILILDYGCYTGVPLPNSHFPELRAENRDENSAFFFKTVY